MNTDEENYNKIRKIMKKEYGLSDREFAYCEVWDKNGNNYLIKKFSHHNYKTNKGNTKVEYYNIEVK